MNLYVVRHGEVPSNLSDIICRRTDEKLTQKGIEQAQKTRTELEGTKFDVIFSSPVARATETTEYVAPNAKVIYDSRLTERGLGNLVGKKWNEINRNTWNSTETETTPEGAETLLSRLNRTKDFLNDIQEKYKGKNVLVVTHNFVSKCIWGIEENITSKDELGSFVHPNGEVKKYFIKDDEGENKNV